MRAHKIIWKSGGFQIISLVVFILIVQLLVSLIKPELASNLLIFWGIIFSIIPALVWLSFFYQRDRLEPEPKHYVLGVFLLGAFLAYAIGIPMVRQVFKVQNWLYLTNWGYVLGSILVVGVIYQFLIYAAIRYTVYATGEFDEWIDGVIYATAAGLGFATVLNIYRVIELGGAKLVISAIFCVVTALAYASFASIIGYSLAMVKFRHDYSEWRLMAGILIAAILNGIFFWVQRTVVIRSMDYNPWTSLSAGIFIVLIVYGIVDMLIRRSVVLQAARTSPKKKGE